MSIILVKKWILTGCCLMRIKVKSTSDLENINILMLLDKADLYLVLKKKLYNCQGFTLIEVVLIIVVMAIAIPTLMHLLSSNLINSTKSEIITQAVIYAQEKIDEIIADKRSPVRGYNWVVASGRYPSDFPSNGFTRSVFIDTTAMVYNGISYALVQVRVNHNDIPEIEITTWLTEY